MEFIFRGDYLYLIYAVNKDDNDNIVKVKFRIMTDKAIDFSNHFILDKYKIIELISKYNFVFKTYYREEQNIEYIIGSRVHVFKEKFLRTDETEIEEDNLDNLPIFTDINIFETRDIWIVTHVRKDKNGVIEFLQTESAGIKTKQEVVNHIDNGGTAYTRNIGIGIILTYEVNGLKHLKTHKDTFLEDNLDNLPLF